MFNYEVKFRPFKGAFMGKTYVMANSSLDAQALIYSKFPHAAEVSVLSPQQVIDVLGLDNVIYVDFKTKKRIL